MSAAPALAGAARDPAAASRLLRTLGAPALLDETRQPVRFRTRKHLALLVYLAVEGGRRHARDTVAELLWPAADPAEARHSLSTALSVLRGLLPEGALVADQLTVQFRRGTVPVDLERLEAGDVLAGEGRAALDVAPFLDGFELDDATHFMHWVDAERARLYPRVRAALLTQIREARLTGQSRDAERHAATLLRMDELCEDGVVATMEARALEGDRVSALRLFEQWKGRLATELGATPSAEAAALAERLRGRAWDVPRSGLAQVREALNLPPLPPRPAPFVGRPEEFRRLWAQIETTLTAGGAGHTLLAGPPGHGKTALADRLLATADLRGAMCLRVLGGAPEQGLAYRVCQRFVSLLLERPGATGTAPEWLTELTRLCPAVRERFPALPAPSPAHGEALRVRFAEAFHALATAVAEEHPVLLVVDDAHLADQVSLEVLHLMMRWIERERIQVLLLAPREAFAALDRGRAILGAAERIGLREEVLGPLDEATSAAVFAAALAEAQATAQPVPAGGAITGANVPPAAETSYAPGGTGPGPAVARVLLQAARGVPRVLGLLATAWRADGERSLPLAFGAISEALEAPLAQAPERRLLQRILDGAPPEVVRGAQVAALLGERMNGPLFGDFTGLTLAASLDVFTKLVALGVLRDTGRDLEYANDYLRAEGYQFTPTPLRRQMHERVVEWLVPPGSPEPPPSLGLELAWHCARCSRLAEARKYLLRGARYTRRLGAVHEVELQLRSGLKLCAGEEQVRGTLLLAQVLQDQGRYAESANVLSQVSETSTTVMGKALWAFHKRYTADITPNVAEESLAALHELASEHGASPDEVVLVCLAAAGFVSETRRIDHASRFISLVAKVEPQLASLMEPETFFLVRAKLKYFALDLRGAEADLRASIRVWGDDQGKPSADGTQAWLGLCTIQSSLGDYAGAMTAAERAFAYARRLGNESLQLNILCSSAVIAMRLGLYDRAIEYGTAGQALWTALGRSPSIPAAYAMALSMAALFRKPEVIQLLDSFEAQCAKQLSPWEEQRWRLRKADVLLMAGERRKAMREGRSAVSSPLADPRSIGPYVRWQLATSASDEDRAAAHTALEEATRRRDTFDLIDKAEIVLLTLMQPSGDPDLMAAMQEELRQIEATLPAAAIWQLGEIGYRSHLATYRSRVF